MAKQTINIGTAANDGTGDPIRTAYDKCNDNFTELYAVDAALPETIRDTVAATLVAGANVSITPNDGGDTIEIASTGGGAGLADAPSDGTTYGRKNGAWEAVGTTAFSGCLLKNAADLTAINASGFYNIPWDSEDYDTDSYHAGSDTFLTITAAGYYQFFCQISISANTASDFARLFVVHKNASNVTQDTIGLPATITEVSATPTLAMNMTSAPIYCNAGDYLYMQVDTEADTSITIVAAQSWFGCKRVG